jgi:hypothetical protein
MLAGGFYSIRGLHAMRKKKYLAALNDGWDGLSMMKQLKKELPGSPTPTWDSEPTTITAHR